MMWIWNRWAECCWESLSLQADVNWCCVLWQSCYGFDHRNVVARLGQCETGWTRDLWASFQLVYQWLKILTHLLNVAWLRETIVCQYSLHVPCYCPSGFVCCVFLLVTLKQLSGRWVSVVVTWDTACKLSRFLLFLSWMKNSTLGVIFLCCAIWIPVAALISSGRWNSSVSAC